MSAAPAPVDASSVLLLHGFGVPGRTLDPLRGWLGRGGWDVATAPLGWNVACGEEAVEVVTSTLASSAEVSGRPTVVVGHSRGGLLGRVAAVRQPGLVAGLVTVCTPWAIGPPDRPGVGAVSAAVRFARRHGMRTMGSIDCADGPCCTRFRAEMREVPQVPWAALWSSTDRIGGTDSVPPDGPTVSADLGTSHLGAVRSVSGLAGIGEALRQLGLARAT